MNSPDPQAVARRIAPVLAELPFPAAKWQLIMHAEDYGADARTRADLWGLPTGTYSDLGDVLSALGVGLGGAVRRYRMRPDARAAGHDLRG